MERLSDTEKQILSFLKKNDGGQGRSFRSIGQKLGIHHQTVANNIKYLVNKGYLREDDDQEAYKILDKPVHNIINLPVYGSAQCGNRGKEIVAERPTDYFPCATKTLGISNPEGYFFVQAKGNSMKGDVDNGDLALIKQQPGYDENDIVLVVYNGKPMIKRFKKIGKDIYLRSTNASHPPVKVDKNNDIQIVGILKKVIKNVN